MLMCEQIVMFIIYPIKIQINIIRRWR